MTYETYQYIFLGSLILAGLFLLLSVFLFVKLHIPKVIADLTGRTERKGIEDIKKRTRQGAATVTSEKVTAKIRKSGRVTADLKQSAETVPAETVPLKQQTIANGTIPLCDVMPPGSGRMHQFSDEKIPSGQPQYPAVSGETAVLNTVPAENGVVDAARRPAEGYNIPWTDGVVITFEITYVSTEEVLA